MSNNATLKTVLWSAFSGALAFTGLTLPVHIWAEINGMYLISGPLYTIYGAIVFISMLYLVHYRFFTLVFDLGVDEKYTKPIAYVCGALYFMELGLFFWLMPISFWS